MPLIRLTDIRFSCLEDSKLHKTLQTYPDSNFNSCFIILYKFNNLYHISINLIIVVVFILICYLSISSKLMKWSEVIENQTKII